MNDGAKDFQKEYFEKRNRLRNIVDRFISKMADLRKRRTEIFRRATNRIEKEKLDQARKSLDEI